MGTVVVGQEVHDRDQQHGDGLPEVKQRGEVGVGEDVAGLAQVAGDDGDGGAGGQQCPGVGEDDVVVVHVRDAGIPAGLVGYLVGVAGGGQAAADVKELLYPGGGQVPYGALEEVAVCPARLGAAGQHPQ